MNTIDTKYIDEKLAAVRYGYSRKWFQRARWTGNGPPFLKIPGNSKILYPLKETDGWFAQHELKINTSSKDHGKD